MTHAERVSAVAALGFTKRQAAFLVLVMLHSGVCLGRQYCAFAGIVRGQKMADFFQKLAAKRYATPYPCGHNKARIFHIHNAKLYDAIGQRDVRFRKRSALARAIERIMMLDHIIAHRNFTWLGAEQDKVAHFLTTTSLRREELPRLAFGRGPDVTVRYFPDKLPIGVSPDGMNINQDCGSTAPQAMCNRVREVRADFGIALDGDADRVVMADEQGRIIDGDQILALIAKSWAKIGRLKGGGVVGTVMSNAGLDRFLKTLNLSLARSAVGDRYVLEEMAKGGFNVGGEQSGHIILSDFSTTGDGLVAALQVLAVLAQENNPASEAAHLYEPLPQVLENVRFKKGSPLDDEKVKSSIESANAKLGAGGRILVRKSGTEPLIRVMAEGEDEKIVRAVVRQIASAIEEVAA